MYSETSLSVGCLDSVEWNGGMERWNGIVEWNSGTAKCGILQPIQTLESL